MRLRAIAVDGTAIEFDRAQFTQHGARLQRQKTKSKQSGSQQTQQSGSQQTQQSGSQQSGQSDQGEQSEEAEVEVVISEDVPEEERAKLEQQLEGSEAQSRARKRASSTQSQKQSASSGSTETIGFITYDRLLYVIPEDVTHSVDDLDELPT